MAPEPSPKTTATTLGTATTINATDTEDTNLSTVDGIDVNLTGTANSSNTNTITGLNFGTVTPATNNTFNGITFGTGFNNFITSPTVNLTAAGAISGLTGYAQSSGNFAISGAGTFSTGTGAVSLNGSTNNCCKQESDTFIRYRHIQPNLPATVLIPLPQHLTSPIQQQPESSEQMPSALTSRVQRRVVQIRLRELTLGMSQRQPNNTVNGLTFGTGFNNFITSPTVNLTAAGAISGLTGYAQSSGNFAISGTGTFSTGPVLSQ